MVIQKQSSMEQEESHNAILFVLQSSCHSKEKTELLYLIRIYKAENKPDIFLTVVMILYA